MNHKPRELGLVCRVELPRLPARLVDVDIDLSFQPLVAAIMKREREHVGRGMMPQIGRVEVNHASVVHKDNAALRSAGSFAGEYGLR